MNNELVKVSNQMALSDVMSMGKVFAESGFFTDSKQASQAVVKILAGQELGIPPFSSMTGISIIKGKPSIGSNLMAGKIKSSGKYDYRIIDHDTTKCLIEFYQGKEKIGNSTFTIDDAKKAGLAGGDNWVKYPKNMLFARAISNGIKFYCPDIFLGPVYTPDELDAIVDEDENVIIDTTVKHITEEPEEEITIPGLDNLIAALDKLQHGQGEEYQKVRSKYFSWLKKLNRELDKEQTNIVDALFASHYDRIFAPLPVDGNEVVDEVLAEIDTLDIQ